MSTSFLSPGWRMPTNKNQSKQANYSLEALSSGEFLTVQDFPFGSSKSFTISFWVYGANLISNSSKSFIGTEYYSPAYTSTQFGFALNFQYGRIQFYTSPINGSRINNFYTANNVLIENEWNHVILRYNYGTDYRIYHNNTLKAIYDSNYPNFAQADVEVQYNTQTLWMYRGYYVNYNLPGKMTEFNCFGYALTDTATLAGQTPTGQVAAIYGDGSSLPNPMAFANPPIAYYPLGTSAWNGNYLAENNAIGDYVFDFNASNNSVINTGILLFLNNISALTISAWVKLDDLTNDYFIFGNRNTDYEGLFCSTGSGSNAGTIGFGAMGNVGGSNPYPSVGITMANEGITIDNWFFVTCRYGSSTIEIFINGNSTTVTSGSSTLGVSNTTNSISSNFLIGGDSAASGGKLNGELSNLQIFNTALPATGSNSIETLYNNGSPLTSMSGFTSLKGWWKLDATATFDSSTEDWTIPDDSTNSNTGTSLGMTQANLVQSDLQTVAPYSKYALNFDGGVGSYIKILNGLQNIFPSNSIYTISTWVNMNSPQDYGCVWGGVGASNFYIYVLSSSKLRIGKRGVINYTDITYSLVTGDWINIVAVYNSTTNVKIYIDNVFIQDVTVGANTNMTGDFRIAGGLGSYELNCKQSNASIWNTGLTSSQVTEIYNEGLPSNLNSHSAYSNLVSWWQLGENSSFTGDWICADEKGSNDGTSSNMGVDALTNGVGTTANGVSSGMGVGALIGDAPYSTANAISSNMSVLAKGTDPADIPS